MSSSTLASARSRPRRSRSRGRRSGPSRPSVARDDHRPALRRQRPPACGSTRCLRIEAVHRLVEDQEPGSPSSATPMPSRWPMPRENIPARRLAHPGEADEAEDLGDALATDAVALRDPQQVGRTRAPLVGSRRRRASRPTRWSGRGSTGRGWPNTLTDPRSGRRGQGLSGRVEHRLAGVGVEEAGDATGGSSKCRAVVDGEGQDLGSAWRVRSLRSTDMLLDG